MTEEIEELRAEIEQLKAQLAAQEKQKRVKVKGGASVRGRYAKGVGKKGILAEDVGGDLLGAEAIKFEWNVYLGAPTDDPVQALRIYRQVLAGMTSNLTLRGIEVSSSDAGDPQKAMGLANIYIDLNTTAVKTHKLLEVFEREKALGGPVIVERAGDVKPVSVLRATIANRRLVLLGDPGSGKSTFVNFLAFCLAANSLQPEGKRLQRLTGWPKKEAKILPVLVLLRDFARGLPEPLPEQAEPCHLWDFLVGRLKAQNLDFAVEPLRSALETGNAFLLLDGLDEVPSVSQRAFVRQAVEVFVKRYPKNRCLVTCRVLSYQPPETSSQPDLRLEGLPTFELAPFDEEKIRRFVQTWYDELARLGTVRADEVGALATSLEAAVRRPDLWRLAPNPLLLTVMALVHTHKGRLPEARALLYEDTVDLLLWRWEQIKPGGREEAPRLRQLLMQAGRGDVDLKCVLWELAYQAQAQTGAREDAERLADIDELKLEKSLASLYKGDRNWAGQVIEAIKLRAGLLIERAPGIFAFPHRTFQEYLAGAHLGSQPDFAARATTLFTQGKFWREVILLAVGRLVYLSGDLHKPLALVGELCPSSIDEERNIGWQNAWLAGDVLLEMGTSRARDSALGRDLLERTQKRLADLLQKGKLATRERVEAGRSLGRLGDPRFRADRWRLPDEPMLGFVKIPAGPFSMGSDRKKDKEAEEDELPRHVISMPDYYMARYPVTVAQYSEFINEGGYLEDRYWTEAIQQKYWEEGKAILSIPELRDGKIERIEMRQDHPYHFGTPYDLPNHPVVGVSWYEAMAYGRWLGERLHELAEKEMKASSRWNEGHESEFWRLLAKENPVVTLPSEAEWEKAAKGEDGLIYPWGDEFDEDNANTSENELRSTSAVGCFPRGASSYGVLDLSGNVWEWTRNRHRKYPYKPEDGREDLLAGKEERRVIRGGCFIYNRWLARCAYRDGNDPAVGNGDLGFRVAARFP